VMVAQDFGLLILLNCTLKFAKKKKKVGEGGWRSVPSGRAPA
jgi:hypothetical protein